jgi:formate dehydrogenase iron-sulfur subunit
MTKVYVSRDSSSRSVGADELALRIRQEGLRLGHDVEIVRTGSRGLTWLEPYIEVETPAGRVGYGNVEQRDLAHLINIGMLDGRNVGNCIGLVDEYPWLVQQDRVTFRRVGVIDPMSLADYERHDGLVALRKALMSTRQQIVDSVKESGLRGRGGAGFPAGIKWQTVLDESADQKYICCNADEGDSGTFADRMIMEGDPFSLIEGMVIAGLAVGATKGYIYIRSEYPDAIATMKTAVETAYANNVLGPSVLGSGDPFELEIRVGAGSYVCGEETAMLESLEGKRGIVRAKPPLPAHHGLFGKPTVINNVMTLATVPAIIVEGPLAYQERGAGRSRGTQVFQLSGNIMQGGIVEVAFGVTLGDMVDKFGGGTQSGHKVKAVQVGGPLGAYFNHDQWDVPLTYEDMLSNGGMLGHGGVVVFDETANMAHQARFAMEFCAEESCGKCTPCRIGSTRGVEVIDRIVAGTDRTKNLLLLEELCDTMTDGSLCAMGGLTPLPVRSAIRIAPQDFGMAGPDENSNSDGNHVSGQDSEHNHSEGNQEGDHDSAS